MKVWFFEAALCEAKRLPAAMLFLAALSASPRVCAQAIDDTTKNAARELGNRAATAYDAGDYATAQDLFHRAYALVPAPSLSLREARALERMGKLVEAVETYVRTVRTPLAADAPDAYRESVRQANEELAKLRPRIPELRIVLKGNLPADRVTVTMDGKLVRGALIGVEMPVNPGAHELSARSQSGAGATAKVVLTESAIQVIELTLTARATRKLPPRTGSDVPGLNQDLHALPGPDADGSAQRTWAYVGLGIGGAGLGTGVIAGLLASSRHSSAESSCPDSKCAPGSSGAKDVDAFRSLRTVSTLSYVAGVVGVGAGVTLMLTAPKSDNRRYVRPYVGIGRLGVQGRF